MRVFQVVLAALAPLFVLAATISVEVGNDAFTPSYVTAKSGDVIEFKLVDGTHTVTQSTFMTPCTATESGFNSGTLSSQSPWSLQINSSMPVWMYCAVGDHCAKGMVFSVNSNENGDQSFTAFQARAEAEAASPPANAAAPRTVFTSVGLGIVFAAAALVL